MCKRMNKQMRDTSDSTNHIDSCQGKALFEALKTCNTQTIKGRNEIHKLLFDKKTGTIGGIYEDMKKFEQLYPKELEIFKKGIKQMRSYNQQKHFAQPPQISF